ncbi:hypothetical protein ACH4CC_12965 [Streptomyces lydicus]|uniref:hypothetical protein n=1 Tax=Streptomyces lydicus TaxID=47763 RepID=UPI0037877430
MRLRPRALCVPLLAVLASPLLVLVQAGQADAHGDSIQFTVTGQDTGHVRAKATYEDDHDPVDERISGMLTAVSADGRTRGPWRLVAVPGHAGTVTTQEVLPPGTWKVTVESGFPELGRGEGKIDVPVVDPRPGGKTTPRPARPTASGTASAAPSVEPATPATAHAAARAGAESGSGSGSEGATAWLPWTATAAAVLAVTATTVTVRRRRRSRTN